MGVITRELYTIGFRRYIDIDGKKVKVPWRYNRPMLETLGLKTIFEYKVGETITCEIIKNDEGYLILKRIAD